MPSSESTSTSLQNAEAQSASTASLLQNILNQLKAHEKQESGIKQQQQQQQQKTTVEELQQPQQQQHQQQQYQYQQQNKLLQGQASEVKPEETAGSSQDVKDIASQDQLREQLKFLIKSGQIRIREYSPFEDGNRYFCLLFM